MSAGYDRFLHKKMYNLEITILQIAAVLLCELIICGN